MKMFYLILLFAVLSTAILFAQERTANRTLPVLPVKGCDEVGMPPVPTNIWKNDDESLLKFSPMTYEYYWLDWGTLADQGNQMPDEVIDGFTFAYATDARWGGLSWNMYFFDSCLGWGAGGHVMEAGFVFTGLPDATNLPPGYYWGWKIHIDLKGSGYEFLMGEEIGLGHSLQTPGIICGPMLTFPPSSGGNGPTGTDDAIDIYDPYGNFNSTDNFGGAPAYPYASLVSALYGANDPSDGCSYVGIPLGGNNTGLYCVGNWALGSYNKFLLRLNHMTPVSGVIFNQVSSITYYAGLGKTTCPSLNGVSQVLFTPDPIGDFSYYIFNCGYGATNFNWYIQGVISNWLIAGPVLPVDLSMDCVRTL